MQILVALLLTLALAQPVQPTDVETAGKMNACLDDIGFVIPGGVQGAIIATPHGPLTVKHMDTWFFVVTAPSEVGYPKDEAFETRVTDCHTAIMVDLMNRENDIWNAQNPR
jgi:hypothetical protein